jgi:hypothetical protein
MMKAATGCAVMKGPFADLWQQAPCQSLDAI